MSKPEYFVQRQSYAIGPVTLAEATRLSSGVDCGTVTNRRPVGVRIVEPDGPIPDEDGVLAIVPLPSSPAPAFEFTPTGLTIHGQPTLDQWIDFGRVLVGAASRLQWAIGDWINHGKERADWGEMYAQALDAFDLEYRYLCNVSWVAREFDSSRRREKLSFSHHQEVAALPKPLQDRLLTKAETDQLSVHELREEKVRETGIPAHRDELDRFEGNFDQAIHWLADMKFKHGWQKRIRIVIFEA